MPIFTGTVLTWSPSSTNTTSTGLFFSSVFLLAFAGLVSLPVVTLVGFAEAMALVGIELVFVPATVFLSFALSVRVVTLAMGAAMALVRVRVSIVALTDMPGRNESPSVSRMRTWNCVADCPDEDELL